MRDFDYAYLSAREWDGGICALAEEIRGYGEAWEALLGRGPSAVSSLAAATRKDSAESSCRLEGVTAASGRVEKLCEGAAPETPEEEEIAGYLDALSLISKDTGGAGVMPEEILSLHGVLYGRTGKDIGGRYKTRQNLIGERRPDGGVTTVFVPLDPYETPIALREACRSLNAVLEKSAADPLLAIPAFIYDFLCIHPFEDGNGRMSRLLTALLLRRCGYAVGKYVSLERITEENTDAYRDALDAGNRGWDDNTGDIAPFERFTLETVLSAYRELEAATGGPGAL